MTGSHVLTLDVRPDVSPDHAVVVVRTSDGMHAAVVSRAAGDRIVAALRELAAEFAPR